MKKIIILIIALVLGINSYSLTPNIEKHKEHKGCTHSLKKRINNNKGNRIVYMCTGKYAYAYHSTQNCPGLNNCNGTVVYLSENDAVNIYKRVPCERCWKTSSNSGNAYSGGSSDDEAMVYAVLGAIVLSTSAVLLSNDVTIGAGIPFYIKDNNNTKYDYGINLGFRKTFINSAIEYGVDYFASSRNYYYYDDKKKEKLNFYLNYVHHLFYNKTPYWLKLYAGPSINYMSDLGYGGILGANALLTHWMKLDARYELTSQTNYLKLGLIFTYQEEYKWLNWF